jgi:hypothetical protein
LLDPGRIKIRIRDKHPGSATLGTGIPYGEEINGAIQLMLMFLPGWPGSSIWV